MSQRIQPRTLKGFRDHLPEAAAPRDRVIEIAKGVYRRFGYAPIDTPALEYTEILLGKGGDETDKQLYRFEDNGGRDVALRFDLTVPLARFVAQHVGELGTPFKRYHVGPVWRGENTQRGRYREFIQCDFDTIGTESIVADIETVLVIHELFGALGFDRFTVRVNNRKVLNGLLERLELHESSTAVLRALDKLPKVGPDAVRAELASAAGATDAQADDILALADLHGENHDILERLGPLVAGAPTGEDGLAQLARIVDGVSAAAPAAGRLEIDVSIARGLDYYTGTVFETFLDDLPGIGSCCSCGRYDDLASLYTSQRLPGVGASLGVDRLLAAMDELGLLADHTAGPQVLVTLFDDARVSDHLAVAAELRRAGLDVELYPDARKLGNQLKYADRRSHRLAIIIGDSEWEAGTAQVKDLASGDSREVARSELADTCRTILSGP
ncbi:MAG: histidine--tRNA ligase [Acidimicrobiales bacterium]|nr:histidine--tRNA ligase [Acidimicrobiales bacterium]